MDKEVTRKGSYEGCIYEYLASGEGPFLGRFSIVQCGVVTLPGDWHTAGLARATPEQAHEEAERAARGVIDTMLYQAAVQDCRVAMEELKAASEQGSGLLRAELKLQTLNQRREEFLRRLKSR